MYELCDDGCCDDDEFWEDEELDEFELTEMIQEFIADGW